MFFKLLKFGLVGTSGLIIDFGITYILKEWLKWNKYVASAVAFLSRLRISAIKHEK